MFHKYNIIVAYQVKYTYVTISQLDTSSQTNIWNPYYMLLVKKKNTTLKNYLTFVPILHYNYY